MVARMLRDKPASWADAQRRIVSWRALEIYFGCLGFPGSFGSPVCCVLNGRCWLPPRFPSAASPVPAGW